MVVAEYLLISIVSLSFVATIVLSLQTSKLQNCPRDTPYCITRCEDRNVTDNWDDYNVCASTLSHRIVNSSTGLVAFSVLIPYESVIEKDDIWVWLMARNKEPPTGDSLCSSEGENFELHSSFMISTSDENLLLGCGPSQLVKVEWQFNYLFTDCYHVVVGLSTACNRTFMVQCDFKKELLADKEIKLQQKVVGQTITANYKFGINFQHNYPQSIIVNLWSNNTYPGTRIACCSTEPQSLHSNVCLYYKSSVPPECSCEWKGARLECEFHDIPPGNYSIDLEVLDTRCNRGTLWAIGLDPCIWRHVGIIVRNITEPPGQGGPGRRPTSDYWLVALVVLALGALCFSFYFGWSKRKSSVIPSLRDEHEIPDTGHSLLPPRVFLLYPRDCKPFMDVMVQLRTLLKLSVNAEVYDIWDDKIRDSVDERGEIWGLEYLLMSDEVLVLIAATPMSRKIEKAILDGCKISYSVPDCRDDIFVSAFKTAIRKYQNLLEPCRKFVVMRIDSPRCVDNILQSFEAPLNTIYTLPGHLDRLLLHLTDCRSIEHSFKVYNAERLRKTIGAYEDATSRQPHDPDLMINVD